MNVAEHLERHLGSIAQGWSSGSIPGVQVCLFRDQPNSGVDTLATLGLSDHVLKMEKGRIVRQELLFAIRGETKPEDFAKLLLHVADEMVTSGRAMLRGQTVVLDSVIADGTNANALYASIPVVFPDALATFKNSSPPSVFVWLFPILPSERALVDSSGWGEFENRLEAGTPDLFDIRRESVLSSHN